MDCKIECLKEALNKFNEEEIQYCILRNYEFLLGKPFPAESLDTIVAEKDLPRVDYLLKSLGFVKRKQQFSWKHKAYFKIVKEKVASFDIQVGGVYWNDLQYLNESILIDRVKKECFYVLSDNDYFVMLAVHSILGKRFFKPKYQQILLSLKTEEKIVLKKLTKIFNTKIARELFITVREKRFAQIPIKKLVAYFILKNHKHPFIFTALSWRWFWQRKNPFKLAPLISVLGPDGSGKSTLVHSLQNYLQENNRKTALIYTGRGRNHLLPITKFGKSYKSKEKKKDILKKIQKIDLKRKLMYTLYAPVFTLDLLLRYYCKILPQRLKKRIVLTDRYCSDIILMKHVPFFFKKILFSLFPRPTLTIFLHNSPAVLHQRRPEETIEELQRQMSIFPFVVRKFKAIEIKTEDKEKDILQAIELVGKKLLVDWW